MMNDADIIRLTVLTPQSTLFDGKVEKVTLPGEKGRFMVLKDHAPIISSLAEGEVVYVSGGEEGRVVVVSGFVQVNANVVTVCAEV